MAHTAKRCPPAVRAVFEAVRSAGDFHFDIADIVGRPFARVAVDKLKIELGVAAAQQRLGTVAAIAAVHLADGLKGQHDTGPEFAPLGEQPGEIIDARQIGQLVEEEPQTPPGRRLEPKGRAGGAFEPAGEQGLHRLEIVFLPRHEDPRLGTLVLVQSVD